MIRRAVSGNPLSSRYFLTVGQKAFPIHSRKSSLDTQAFVLDLHMIPQLFFMTMFSEHFRDLSCKSRKALS